MHVMDEIDLILPVLNEAQALSWVLDRVPPGVRPIVVDNGSTDGSAQTALSHNVAVIDEPRRGFGSACAAGLAHASAPLVAFCDADASIDPEYVLAVARPVIDGVADLVMGVRVPAERAAWPLHARMANRYLTRVVNRRVGTRLSDLGPLRVARREELLTLELQDRRFGWPLEMVVSAAQAGWKVMEVPIPYRCRIGRSKVTGTISGTLRAIRDMQAVLDSTPKEAS